MFLDKSASVESGVEELDLEKKPVKPVEPENEVKTERELVNFGFINSPVAGPSHEFHSIGSATLGNKHNTNTKT